MKSTKTGGQTYWGTDFMRKPIVYYLPLKKHGRTRDRETLRLEPPFTQALDEIREEERQRLGLRTLSRDTYLVSHAFRSNPKLKARYKQLIKMAGVDWRTEHPPES